MEQFSFTSAFRPAAVLAAFSRASDEGALRLPTAPAVIEQAEPAPPRGFVRRVIDAVLKRRLFVTAISPAPADPRSEHAPREANGRGALGPSPALASHFELVQASEIDDEARPLPLSDAA